MKPEEGRSSEFEGEMDMHAMEAEELARWVGLMVLEARGPGKQKQCQEGTHCPDPMSKDSRAPHVCTKSRECLMADELRREVERSLKNHIPVCIDVILLPKCIHSTFEAVHLRPFISMTSDPSVLLERWTITLDQKRHMAEKMEAVGSPFGLLSAVRSQLYFSQLSSWIQTHPDGLPLIVAFRISAPGETGLKSFREKPVTKTLPVVDLKYSYIKVCVSELPRQKDNSIISLECVSIPASCVSKKVWEEFETKPSIQGGAMSQEWPVQGRPSMALPPRFQHPGMPRPMSFVQDGTDCIRWKQRSVLVPGGLTKMSPCGAMLKQRVYLNMTLPLDSTPITDLKVPAGASTMKRLYSPNVLVTSDQDGIVTQFEQLVPQGDYYCFRGLETTQRAKAGLLAGDSGYPSCKKNLGNTLWEPLHKGLSPVHPLPVRDCQREMDQQGSDLWSPQLDSRSQVNDEEEERVRNVSAARQRQVELDFEGEAEDGLMQSEGIHFYLEDDDGTSEATKISNTLAWVRSTRGKGLDYPPSPCNNKEIPLQNSCSNTANQLGNKTSTGKKKRNRRRKKGKKEEPEQKDKPSKPEEKPVLPPPCTKKNEKGHQEKRPPDCRAEAAPPRRGERFSRKDVPRHWPDVVPPYKTKFRKNLREPESQDRRIWYRSKEAENVEERRGLGSQDATRRKSTSSELESERWNMLEQERPDSSTSSPPPQHATAPPREKHWETAHNAAASPHKLAPALVQETHNVKAEGLKKKDEEDDDDDEDFELSSLDEDSDIEPIQTSITNNHVQTTEAEAAGAETPVMSAKVTAKSCEAAGGSSTSSCDKVRREIFFQIRPTLDDSTQELRQTAQSSHLCSVSAQTPSCRQSSCSANAIGQGKVCDVLYQLDLKRDKQELMKSPKAPVPSPRTVQSSPDWGPFLQRETLCAWNRDSDPNIPEFSQDSAVCLQPRDTRTVTAPDCSEERTDSLSNLADVFNQYLQIDKEEREDGVEGTRTCDNTQAVKGKPLQSGYKFRNSDSPSTSTNKPTDELSSTAKPILKNKPVSHGTSNGFAPTPNTGTSSVPNKERVPLRKLEAGERELRKCTLSKAFQKRANELLDHRTGHDLKEQTNGFCLSEASGNAPPSRENLASESQRMMTSFREDVVKELRRSYLTEMSSTLDDLPGTCNIPTDREHDEDFMKTGRTCQAEVFHLKEKYFECTHLEHQETSGLKSTRDPLSLNSSLETLVGSLPKGDHSADSKGGNSGATFYEPDASEDGDFLGMLASVDSWKFTTKDDLSTLFHERRGLAGFGNDGEVSDEVFAKSSPPSPVKLGPGREDDVLLRDSSHKGGRCGLKRPRSESSKLPETMNAVEMCAHRQYLRKSHSLIFNGRTALPSQSSPAPIKRKSMNNFGFDDSLTKPRAISSALSCSRLASDEDQEEGEDNTRTLSTSAPASTNCLLGNFEESVLNGRIEPMGIVDGFTAEIGASGSFCPKHKTVPVTAYFFKLSDDNAPSPYLGHINLLPLGKKGYHIPKKGTVQVTLFNPSKTVVKMFVVMYDLSEMPPYCQTFLRQRTLYQPVDRNSSEPSYLRYLIHLRFASSGSGRIYLHTDIRLIFARDKFELDSKVSQYELRSFTECPKNPKFSRRR